MLWRLIKFLFILAVLAGLVFLAYAYVGPFVMPADFAAPAEPVSQIITLELD